MSTESFPLLKLVVLAFKQMSKPIANVIKDRAKDSPIFRRYVAIPPAQLYNWIEMKTRMLSMNLGKARAIPPLDDAMATELGARLLGELIIFSIAAALLTMEYVRQSNIESKKEELVLLEKMELHNTINDVAFQLKRQEVQIKEITRTLAEIESRKWFRKRMIKLTDLHSASET